MQYLSEMRTKYGFSDGEAIPPGIEIYREMYVKVINDLAEFLGSRYRAEAYDRVGVHNWCLIIFKNLDNPELWDTDEYDEEFESALASAYDVCVDCFINVKVSISKKDLRGLLNEVKEVKKNIQQQEMKRGINVEKM